MQAVEDIVIVGAGIAGLSTALGLYRMGLRSLILESADQLRVSGFSFLAWMNAWKALDTLGVGDKLRNQHILLDKMGLRSLILESADQLRVSGFSFLAWMNAWKALDTLGVGDKLRNQHILLDKTFAYTTVNGVSPIAQLSLRTSGKHGTHEARCVRRKLVVEALADELPRGSIRYNSGLVSIEQKGHVKLLHLADGSVIKTKILIGCDGVNSVVAKWLDLPEPVFTGRVATRGLAEYPDSHDFKAEFLQYFGDGFRCGFLPVDEKSIYWFFTSSPSLDVEKGIRSSASKAKQFVMSKLANLPEEVRGIIERTETDIVFSSPLRLRLPWDVVGRSICKGNVCVAGDALHPMTPDLAQGGCSALEDGITLARFLGEALLEKPKGGAEEGEEEEHKRIEKVLEKYARERKWRLFNLTTTAYLLGAIQQSSGMVLNFVRDRCFPRMLLELYLKWSDFDCGKLYIP